MKRFYRMGLLLAVILALASPLLAQDKKKEGAPAPVSSTAAGNAAIVKAMDNAMDPGEGQKKLEFLVGNFDVKVRVWLDPSKPPIESMQVAVGTWVLGHRYIQMMLSGFVMGEPINGIGYAGYDNVATEVRGMLHGFGQHGHGVVHRGYGSGR